MNQGSKQVSLQAQVLIDAIDQNRQALDAVLDKIHQDMDHRLVVLRDEDGNQETVDFNKMAIGRVLLANYLAAFLTGECPTNTELDDSINNFYDTGFAHGSAYAEARQSQLH